MDHMNTRSGILIFPLLGGLLLLLLPGLGQAKPPRLHYQFSDGETNVYAVEITVQGENGQEVTKGNVFIATTSASTNAAILNWHGDLRTENRNQFRPGMGFYGGQYMRGMNGFARGAELDINEFGQVLRNGGDYPLPVPLGELVAFIFEPLPPKVAGSLEIHDEALVLDAPLLTGPVESFASQSPFGPGAFFGGGPYGGYNPRNAPATLRVDRHVNWQVLSNTESGVTFRKTTSLRSLLQTGGDVRLSAQSEARLEFNLAAGRFDTIAGTGGFVSITETTSQQSKITFACHRLTGDALTAALAPPAPPVTVPLSDADIQKLLTDLKSDDDSTRRMAISRLSGATITTPPPELLSLLATMVTDSDMFNRMTAMNFLSQHATPDQVPVLLKVLDDSDMGIRQNAIKALARLRDPRAIGPLVGLVARGGSFTQDATSALISAGPDAEKAVLPLLNEKNVETRRQACVILQQIGTRDSLETLQKQMADPDQQLSQAAVEAVRAINARQ
jgi:hypothetical protein